jgi:hypothetical protein
LILRCLEEWHRVGADHVTETYLARELSRIRLIFDEILDRKGTMP